MTGPSFAALRQAQGPAAEGEAGRMDDVRFAICELRIQDEQGAQSRSKSDRSFIGMWPNKQGRSRSDRTFVELMSFKNCATLTGSKDRLLAVRVTEL